MSHEIVSLNDGGKVETWTNGKVQVLCVSRGTERIDVAIPDHEACRLAYAMSPVVGENFDRARKASHALWELSYPASRAQELREVANYLDERDCDEPCSQHDMDRGDFCKCFARDNLRQLADALDLKAKIGVERIARWRWLRWAGYRTFMPVWPRLAIRCLRPEEIPF